jgi:hypothetical protein
MLNTAAAPGQPGDPYKVSQICTARGKADVTIAWAPAHGAEYYEVWHTWSQMYGTTKETRFTIRNVDAPYGTISRQYPLTVHVVAVNKDGRAASNMVTIWITKCDAASCEAKTGIARWWCERASTEKTAIIIGGAAIVGIIVWLSVQKTIAAAGAPQITVTTGGSEK